MIFFFLLDQEAFLASYDVACCFGISNKTVHKKEDKQSTSKHRLFSWLKKCENAQNLMRLITVMQLITTAH